MKPAAHFGLGIACSVAAAAIGAAAFVSSGAYDIGADDHHTKFVTTMIEVLRERSISVRVDGIEVPRLGDTAMIAAGAAHEVTGLHEIAGRVVGHLLKCAGPALRA